MFSIQFLDNNFIWYSIKHNPKKEILWAQPLLHGDASEQQPLNTMELGRQKNSCNKGLNSIKIWKKYIWKHNISILFQSAIFRFWNKTENYTFNCFVQFALGLYKMSFLGLYFILYLVNVLLFFVVQILMNVLAFCLNAAPYLNYSCYWSFLFDFQCNCI